MKRTVLLLLAVGVIGSCAKENNAPVVPTPTPTPAPTSQVDHISKIEIFKKGSSTNFYEISFTYDGEKRLTSFGDRLMANEETEVSRYGIFSYANPTTIKGLFSSDDPSITKPLEYYLYLDNQAKATKLVRNFHYESETRSDIDDSYTYDSNGHLTGFKTSTDWICELIWQDGNLIKTIEKSKDGTEEGSLIAYTSIPNRTYPDLNLCLSVPYGGPHFEDYWGDYLGQRSINLLSSYTGVLNGRKRYGYSFVYKLDDKERPIEVDVDTGFDSHIIYVITYLEK